MKKLVLSLIITVFMSATLLSGSLFAIGDLHVKVSEDVSNRLHGPEIRDDMKLANTFELEYLQIISEIFKIGGGVQYLMPRKLDIKGANVKYSWLPVYATLQISPFKDNGVFFKGNFGYVAYFDDTTKYVGVDVVEKEGGIYWGFATGYEFKAGIILEMAYEIYHTQKDISYIDSSLKKADITQDFTYSKLGLKVGYRFKF